MSLIASAAEGKTLLISRRGRVDVKVRVKRRDYCKINWIFYMYQLVGDGLLSKQQTLASALPSADILLLLKAWCIWGV